MHEISNLFLRAKHWQIFLLFFGAGVTGWIAQVLASIARIEHSNIGYWVAAITLGAIAAALWCSYFVWLWSMGSLLNSIPDHGISLKTESFRFASFYSAVSGPLFMVFVPMISFNQAQYFIVIFPLSLFSLLCGLYLVYFVSKSFFVAETTRGTWNLNYASTLLLFLFSAFGVWTTQPRINRLYEERKNDDALAELLPI